MTDDERSAEARTIAERALGQLLAASAPTSERLIVLGGLVPPTLARTDTPEVPAHLGTTDVDILLVTHLTAGHDLGPIEAALDAMQFNPNTEVVLLGSDSVETLERTHSSYFELSERHIDQIVARELAELGLR